MAWSRTFADQNLLLAFSTDSDEPRSAWVELDARIYPVGKRLTCLYSSDPVQIGQSLEVQQAGERHAVRLSLPAAGFVIIE